MSSVVSCPHFTAAVAHGHQVRVQLDGMDRALFKSEHMCAR